MFYNPFFHNPFAIFGYIAEGIVDCIHENEELRRKEFVEKEREKQKLIEEKRIREYELWKKITHEEFENPDEFRVLPYGWSPFGFYI